MPSFISRLRRTAVVLALGAGTLGFAGAAMAAGGYRTAYLGKWHLAPVGADERSGAKLATLPAPTPCSRRRSR